LSVVQASVDVEAPPERVWEVVADPTNLTRWDHHIEAVEGVPEDGLREGNEYMVTVRLVAVRARVKVRVVELRPHEYAKVRLDGLLDGTVQTWLEPVGAGGTRLRHRIQYRFRGGPFGRLAARGVKLLGASMLLRRGTQAQKLQAEAAG
jgi:carbon monoxide dehydrogenase subunit G